MCERIFHLLICLLTQIDDFVRYIEEQAQVYRTNNIMIPMGGRFHYMASHINFKNLDKLMG